MPNIAANFQWKTSLKIGFVKRSLRDIHTSSEGSEQLGLVFTRESSYCFQRVLAIAILSVCHTGGSVKNGTRQDHQIFTDA